MVWHFNFHINLNKSQKIEVKIKKEAAKGCWLPNVRNDGCGSGYFSAVALYFDLGFTYNIIAQAEK